MERNKSLGRYLGITISKASYLGNIREHDKAQKQIYSDAASFGNLNIYSRHNFQPNHAKLEYIGSRSSIFHTPNILSSTCLPFNLSLRLLSN